tara:strand:+ start:232 stop:669 length:438 start_codon:yes stop_codon:yes gene_type:complete
MILDFKIHSNYLIQGTNVKVSWETSGALFIKIHTDSWKKGWYKKNDEIEINLSKAVKKVTLYAFGFKKIQKKEIIIELNKQKDFTIERKKIKKINFKSKNNSVETINNFSTLKVINGLKPNDFIIKPKQIQLKINYSNLKINDHE